MLSAKLIWQRVDDDAKNNSLESSERKKSRRIIYAKKCLFPLWEKDVTEDFFSPQAEVFSRAVDF